MDSGDLKTLFIETTIVIGSVEPEKKLFLWQHPHEKNTKILIISKNSLINLMDRGHLKTDFVEEIIVIASVEPKKQLFLCFYRIFHYPPGTSQFTIKETS